MKFLLQFHTESFILQFATNKMQTIEIYRTIILPVVLFG